jgi:Fanconi anemia group M protein
MFYNPFSKISKKSKNNSNKLKPKIIADVHEKNSAILIELKSNSEINLEVKSLEIGDYIINQIGIERKTISDFISSMISKRLTQQLKQLKRYKKQVLIIEGDRNKIDEFSNSKAIRGFILSIIFNYSVPIIFTKDIKETSQYLITLAKQQAKKPTEISLHSRIPKTLEEQKIYILESFPGLGPQTSKKLLKNFKTLNQIFNCSEEEIKNILKSKTIQFKRILNS